MLDTSHGWSGASNGRTASINGMGGTDLGTGAAALLISVALRGGRVIADQPGLAPASPHQGRGLNPTISLHPLTGSGVAGHFGLDSGARRERFPLCPNGPANGPVGS